MTTTPARPRQVTLAGWLILAGSVAVLLLAYQQIAGLGSLEAQEQARDLVSEPPLRDSGLTADDIRAIQRVLGLVAGAAAAASAILGAMVLRRRQPSDRVALTVLAPALLVAGIAVAGLAAGMVVAAIVMLWATPARSWYRGDSSAAAPLSAPRVPIAVGAPPGVPTGAPTPTPASTPDTAPTRRRTPTLPDVAPRPGGVLTAAILTWVGCGVVSALFALTVVVVLSMPETLLDAMREQDPGLADRGITASTLQTAAIVMTAIVVPWCLAAAVLAFLALRRVAWAAILLAISAAVAGLGWLVTALANPVAVLPLVACALTVWFLTRTDSRAWFSRREGSPQG